MTDFVEMFRHWNAGRSQVQINEALGIDRKTIRKYLAPALAEGLQPSPGGVRRGVVAGADRALVPRAGRPGGAGTDMASDRGPSPVDRGSAEGAGDGGHHRATAARRPPCRGVGVDGTALHSNHFRRGASRRQGHGAARCGRARQRSSDRLRHASGMWCDPASGRRVAVWVFAMILSCSRALFVQPVLRMDQTSWNASHVAAFEFFGGVPARLVCDNLKTGVTRPDLYDPQINLAYGELAGFFGTLIDPARARKPKDKPRDRTADALHSGLVLRRPRVHLPGPDAGRGTALGHRGLRGSQAPRPGWPDPGDRCSPRSRPVR